MSTQGRFSNPFIAVFTGVWELFRRPETIRPLGPQDTLEGKTVLVTGANSGLGLGVAERVLQRGGRLIMACRGGIPEAGAQLQTRYPEAQLEMRQVDFRDFAAIRQLVAGLQQDGIQIDVLIDNAGVTPARARKTESGLDEMFMVNYLAKFYLAQELLRSGVIANQTYAGIAAQEPPARMIYISSDSHQNASAIDIDQLGAFEDYRGPNRGVSLYSYNKLVLNTFVVELSRRLSTPERVDVSVQAICPGPVDSNIIRDAPPGVKVVLKLVFKLFFTPPLKAALPVIYAAAAPELAHAMGKYLHMNRPKQMDAKVYDPEVGQLLWEKSADLVVRYA